VERDLLGKLVVVEFNQVSVVEGEMLEDMVPVALSEIKVNVMTVVVVDELNDNVIREVLDVVGFDIVEFDNLVARLVLVVLVGSSDLQPFVRSVVGTVTVRVTVYY
jgi:hypothetical protein